MQNSSSSSAFIPVEPKHAGDSVPTTSTTTTTTRTTPTTTTEKDNNNNKMSNITQSIAKKMRSSEETSSRGDQQQQQLNRDEDEAEYGTHTHHTHHHHCDCISHVRQLEIELEFVKHDLVALHTAHNRLVAFITNPVALPMNQPQPQQQFTSNYNTTSSNNDNIQQKTPSMLKMNQDMTHLRDNMQKLIASTDNTQHQQVDMMNRIHQLESNVGKLLELGQENGKKLSDIFRCIPVRVWEDEDDD
jgi:hypothetical protein